MPNVSLNLLNRTYQMACDVGQEKHLQQLAEKIDQQLRQIAKQAPQATENYLLAMLLLMQADQLGQIPAIDPNLQSKQDNITATAILHLNERISQMNTQLQSWLKAV
jgi:cell division protein ZapA